ncbi:MAG TPA: ATPase [Cyanobacteria bacterium UBA10660]|nr:MAG TPA: ATPase [Candidatus Gastranaerophilales bacterium HUM_1]HAS93773.1 ATPase [Cyanobacteria bacterium UBA10660]
MNKENAIGQVYASEINQIIVRSDDLKKIEDVKNKLSIGNLIKISDGNCNDHIIAIIQNMKIVDSNDDSTCKMDIICQPIGTYTEDGFQRGIKNMPLPCEEAFPVNADLLKTIFEDNNVFNFQIGYLAQNNNIKAMVDGDKLFSKHIAVVGSTGAGKSCVVSKLLQEAVGFDEGLNKNKEAQKNSHIIIFDIHSEYANAFKLMESEKFNLNLLSIDNLKLPYWLMNSEELEDMFIESNDQNSYNQVSQFKSAVIKNKILKNKNSNVNYDTPVEFNIQEVKNYLENLNRERVDKKDKKTPILDDDTKVEDRYEKYFSQVFEFKQSDTNNGPYSGDFARFVTRLETRLADDRLKFLLSPEKDDGSSFHSNDFQDILKQFIGYVDDNKSNITIIDLSGIPFEVLSTTISLISRIVFDFAFNYSKLKHTQCETNDIPIMLVCEEAHNYIPKSNESQYKSSKKSIERIAKEGRKYGLSLMVVSQRPSEVSETIMAQCNNFIALRLNNTNDQSYVKNLLPDNIGSICETLPSLNPGEALIVGDAALLPSVVQFKMPHPRPKSETINFRSEWEKNWQEIIFEEVIKKWRKETTT